MPRPRPLLPVSLLLLALLLSACAKPHAKTVYQYAIFDNFAAGNYAGSITLAGLKKHGDFGIGTFDGLDGEMIMLDGVANRADGTCSVSQPADSTLSPFAHLVFFQADASAPVSLDGDTKALTAWLDGKLPPGMFAAARVTGEFRNLTIRSVPGYQKPYPNLTDALKTQHVEKLPRATGTLVCLRGPAEPTGAWVSGWHIHFLSLDGRMGGHVLGFEGVTGKASWMSSGHYELELPGESAPE